jgi:hypothetical protein
LRPDGGDAGRGLSASAIQKRGIRKQVDRARREGKLCDAEYTYVFEDDGFTVTSSETTVPYRWESVAQVRKGKRMLLLIVMPGKKLMPVPAGASGNGPRYERLAALLEEKIPKEKMAEFL